MAMKVTTADFIKNYGTLADKALSEPVTITKNGRDRLVLVSADEYARLKRRDRRVVRLEDFTEEELALRARASARGGRAPRCGAERLEAVSFPEPRPGLVIRYSYLWEREAPRS